MNVVEEMAIASGVPMPEVYLLEHESGINAFAAGHNPANAAIGVTRGAIATLNRSELQGVIAHEFSQVMRQSGTVLDDIDFARVRREDRLVAEPPGTLDDIRTLLEWLERHFHVLRFLDTRDLVGRVV